MREVRRFSARELRPDPAAVLENQGVPKGQEPSARLRSMAEEAAGLFEESAEPKGLISEVPLEEFREIYRGEGKNAPETPLLEVLPRAKAAALFAVTLGRGISARIEELFRKRDFAPGAMLDAAASLGADRAAETVQRRFAELLRERGGVDCASPSPGVSPSGGAPSSGPSGTVLGPQGGAVEALRYSPGYCGWHITGQRRLFQALRPEEIGITLGESCLMEPLKSVSGVILSGGRGTHEFKDAYPFCGECKHRSCRKRIESGRRE